MATTSTESKPQTHISATSYDHSAESSPNGSTNGSPPPTHPPTLEEVETLNVVPLPKASGRLGTDNPKVEELQKAWNDNRGGLRGWRGTSTKRRKEALVCYAEHGLEGFTEAVKRLAASAFCTGTNDRGWVAGPDFILRPGKLQEVLEGKYDNRVAVVRKNGLLDIAHNMATSKEYDEEGLFQPVTLPEGGKQ